MSTRFAAIDLGTNTILLLVAELNEDGSFSVLTDRAEIARLGEGVDKTRAISLAGEERSFATLKDYLRECKDLGVDEVVAAGTSALRDARNGPAFIQRLKRELGLDLRVLSGEDEARYSYLAVARGLRLNAADVLVADVGGGSTEFIWAKAGALHRSASLNLGSVRLTERFFHSDPVRPGECDRMAAAIDPEIRALLREWGRTGPFDVMVGIAGTFTTLAAVMKGLKTYSHSEVHGSLLPLSEVERQVEIYRTKTIAERKQIAGLEPKRADVILAGALLIQRIMTLFGMESVTVSDQGIRYGLLYEKIAGI
jgi:exopolyphosphatase/guanosine-5'-triphosphate,3'-diphosphate pyrophosphatase